MPNIAERIEKGFAKFTHPYTAFIYEDNPETFLQFPGPQLQQLAEMERDYIQDLRSVDTMLARVIDHPKAVFFAQNPHQDIQVFTSSKKTSPPRTTGYVELTRGIVTPDQRQTIRHLVALVVYRSQLNDDERKRIERWVKSGLTSTPDANILIGAWVLRIRAHKKYSHALTAYLDPVEQEDWSRDWIKLQLKNITNVVEPDRVSQLFLEQAQTNFALSEVRIGNYHLFDLGGWKNLHALESAVTNAGWKRMPPPMGVEDQNLQNEDAALYFVQPSNSETELMLRLSLVKSIGSEFLEIYTHPSAILKKKLLQRFLPQLQTQLKHTVERNIAGDSEDVVDLTPATLIHEALIELNQTPDKDEFVRVLPRLCEVAVFELIAKFRDFQHPELHTITDELEKGIMSREHLVEITESGVEVDSGWDAAQVKLVLPKTYFETNASSS